MTALDEVQHAFRLADTALAGKEESHTEHVGERAVKRGRGCEQVVEDGLDPAVKLAGLERCPEDGHALLGGDRLEPRGELLPLGDEHARQVEREELAEDAVALVVPERAEVGDLRLPERL